MAIMNKFFLASAALVAIANAAPLDVRAPMVTETVWTTVDVDVTVWVDQNGTPVTTVQGTPFAVATTPASVASVPTSTAAAASVPSQAAGSFYQPSTYVPSTTAAASPSTSSAAAPAPSTTQAQAASASPAAVVGSGSSTANCEGAGNVCSGDITHWDGGLGACGWNVDTNSDMSIALPVGFMGAQSNGNPYCGRTVTIVNPNNGQSVQATVGDKCMGCVGRSIDLTDKLFNAIGGGCDGRCSGFEWYFS